MAETAEQWSNEATAPTTPAFTPDELALFLGPTILVVGGGDQIRQEPTPCAPIGAPPQSVP